MHPRYRRYWGYPPAWFQALSGPAQLGAVILAFIAIPFLIPAAIGLLLFLLSTVLLEPSFWVVLIVLAFLLLFQK